MNRQEKAAAINALKDSFANSAASFLVVYRGLTVAQLQALRKALRQEEGAQLKVAKPRLIKRAITNMVQGPELLNPYLKDQIGVVFVRNEAPAVAKILCNFAQSHQALNLVAGYMDDTVLDASAVQRMATLPSKKVLLAQVCGTVQAPLTGCVSVLNQMIVQLVWTLKAVGEKKQ